MTGRFTLIEHAGIAAGTLDLTTATGEIGGIRIDLLMLVRNDPGALTYPPDTLLDADARAQLTADLMPQLRLLTRGRVVPLASDLAF